MTNCLLEFCLDELRSYVARQFVLGPWTPTIMGRNPEP